MRRDQEIRAWLDANDQIRSACDLDLLLFLARHSSAMLTTDQIASFVGYSRSEIGDTLDHLLARGVVTRMRGRSADVDLYLVGENAGRGSNGALSSLIGLASTREGRLAVLDALGPRSTAKGEEHGGS